MFGRTRTPMKRTALLRRAPAASTSSKPKVSKCRHCRAKFAADEKGPLHPGCVDGWYEANREKIAKAAVRAAAREAKRQAKAERQQTKQRKAALKRIPDLIAEAQIEFNKFVRTRDAQKPCICCGKPLHSGVEVGGGYDAGHYRSTGSAPHLRFNEDNCHAQRKHCNRYGAGRAVDYRIGLIARIGAEAVERLEASNAVHKWQRDELIAIKELYKAKRRELEGKT